MELLNYPNYILILHTCQPIPVFRFIKKTAPAWGCFCVASVRIFRSRLFSGELLSSFVPFHFAKETARF